MQKVFFAFPSGGFLRDYEPAYLPLVSDELERYGTEAGFVLTPDPAQADLIILLQSAQYKTIKYLDVLENDPLVREHAERIFVIDYDDHPEGMLAGLYTSIEAPFFDPQLHRSWPILLMNNSFVYGLRSEDLFQKVPQRLFSFIGAPSDPVRTRLFQLFGSPSSDWHVEILNKWYNHSDADRARFVDIARDSLFCLCPRGYASYTNRIPEVMAMGRVPVIIADDWVPFAFPEKDPYYIRVAEKEIEHLPEILAAQRGAADELRHNARRLWEKHCSLHRRTVAAVEAVARLAGSLQHRMTYESYRRQWRSREFLRRCGWTLPQRLALRVRQYLRKR
jgi:hypothetical protein